MTDDKLDLGPIGFTDEDAEPSDVIYRAKVISVDRANELLAARLKAHGVRVEGNVEFDCWASEMDRHPEAHMSPTHTALLILPRKLGEAT